MSNNPRALRIDMQVDNEESEESLIGEGRPPPKGKKGGAGGPTAAPLSINFTLNSGTAGKSGTVGNDGAVDGAGKSAPYPRGAKSQMSMEGIDRARNGWNIDLGDKTINVRDVPESVQNKYPEIAPIVLAVALELSNAQGNNEGGGGEVSGRSSGQSAGRRAPRASAARPFASPPAMSSGPAIGGIGGIGDARSFTGISGVDDAEEAMAMIAKAAKDKLRQIAAKLKAAGDRAAQLAGQQNPTPQQQQAQKAADNEKDQLMIEMQIAMAEWSQATQAQSNIRSKNDKTLDAIVGNLR